MYIGRILTDRPYGFWSMDSAAPFQDLSGNANNATATGTYKYSNTLVAGGGRSLVANSAYVPSFSFPLLKRGYELRPWTWELWFHPLQCDETIYLLNHEAAHLYYDGTYLTFLMFFDDSTAVTLDYEVLVRESMYIVVTHSANRVSMFINGELVASAEISDAQNLAGYDIDTPSAVVTSGNGSTDQILIDSVAVYGYDLSPAKIRRHFQFGRDVSLLTDVVDQELGYYFEPNDLAADVYMKLAWDTDADFNTSPLTDVRISDGIRPAIDDTGAALPSSWVMPINMSALSSTTVEYLRIGWIGAGTYTVEIRTDDLTWTPVSNDVAININADVMEKIFDLRVSFDGTDADAFISYLDFTAYKTSVIKGSLNPRQMTYEGVVTINRSVNEPIEHNLKRGADISGGGRIKITPDTESDPVNTKTVDVWANFNAAQPFCILDMRSVGNTTRPYLTWNGTDLDFQGISKTYVNGVLIDMNTWAPTTNASCLITVVLSTASNYEVSLGSSYTGAYVTNGQIESVAFYDHEPSANDVLRMYNSYYGIVTDVITDDSEVTIVEPADAYELYTYAWSITGAG